MTRLRLEQATIDQLVARFVEIGLAQDRAIDEDATGRFNRLFGNKVKVMDELKARPGDQRHALLRLLDHPNLQVRLNAAKATLAVAPAEARQALEAIRATRWQPQAGDAGMSLWSLERGFKPR